MVASSGMAVMYITGISSFEIARSYIYPIHGAFQDDIHQNNIWF